METKKEDSMIPDHMKGAPIVAFLIVLLAVVYMGGMAWSFQGSVHF